MHTTHTNKLIKPINSPFSKFLSLRLSTMAESDLTSPLLSSQPSDPTHIILNVEKDQTVSESSPFDFIGSKYPYVSAMSSLDPFRNHTERIEGLYEWMKICICMPIAVVRLVLFGIALLVGYIATKTALEGWKDKKNPMPAWRCRIMWITRICARCILFSFGYHWIKRRGKPIPREMAPIVVSNHVSYIDPIFFFYEMFPTLVSSESHNSIPFVGTIIRAMQVIYVNRFSPSSRKQAVNEIKRKASCDKFPRVLIFPEGTTTNGRLLISFQLGAFIPAYPVQPVVVRYPYVHFDQSWGNIPLVKLMFRMLTQFHNFMEVEYLPVISPLDFQKETAFHFARRTSHAMATALNVVQTSHSYADFMLFAKAAEAKQENPTLYMVEMASAELAFHLKSMEALDFLDTFLAMNPDSSGCVEIHDFLRVLRLKPCSLSEKIFGLLDVDKVGRITFKQFLFGSAHVLKQPLFRQACELAFANCCNAENLHISEHDLGDSAQQAIPNLNLHEIHELFRLFDMDCDGRISKDDFSACLRRNPLLISLFSPHLMHNILSEAVLDRKI